MIPMIDLLIESAGQFGIEELVIGMAHRGRLNVLANVLGKNVREIFAAFDDKRPERFLGAGDVKYHLGYSSDVKTQSGRDIHLSMAFNPSHLEFVNPVVEGRVRAKIDRRKRKSTMPLLIHGDASFMGQGVVPETLNLSKLEGYTTGGTIHLVVNNQIGFTTLPEDSRSTRYCTDVARMLRIPVFHVNGEDPEAVIQVTRLAIEFRQRFKQDVAIDLYCYRKYGHNEGDEPRYTQPVMYALIDKKPTVREVYVARLVRAGHITREEADAIAQERRATLERALEEARQGDFHQMPETMGGVWENYKGGPDAGVPEVPTAFPENVLVEALEKLTMMPPGFHPNHKALKIVEQRRERAVAGQPLDWGTAEHLAFATILLEGHGIRISGQDARRGTFSHRHAVLFDAMNGEPYTPLAHLANVGSAGSNGAVQAQVGRFEIYDSPLSEAGVLGFEYGYSLDRPDKLVVWEAQFGDFANGAQVIIDQFIVSAEDKWSRLSGLVLLLPHGFEGQGPEHSSGRIERFLQLAAEDNIQVCNLTTPAQFFHVLRRQVKRPWRKPLVIFTPKSLLRHVEAVSMLDELATGSFQRVLPDVVVEPEKVKRILLCSGKVYYDLAAERRKRKRDDVAIVRVEQLYPLSDALPAALSRYQPGTPVVWVQEEPRNMGAWYFINARKAELFSDRHPLSHVSRAESKRVPRRRAARERTPSSKRCCSSKPSWRSTGRAPIASAECRRLRRAIAHLGLRLPRGAPRLRRLPRQQARAAEAPPPAARALALRRLRDDGGRVAPGPARPRAGRRGLERALRACLAICLGAFTLVNIGALAVFDVALPALGVSFVAITGDLVVFGAYVFASLGVLRAAGVSPSSVVTTSAVVSGVLALGMQTTLGNVIGGVALQLDGSVDVGDWIQLGDGQQGKVVAIRWRHTVLETRNWDTIVVPNANLLAQNIVILGKRSGKPVQHRMWVYFNVDFRHPPSRVIDVVREALCAAPIEGVARDPLPSVICFDLARDGRDSFGWPTPSATFSRTSPTTIRRARTSGGVSSRLSSGPGSRSRDRRGRSSSRPRRTSPRRRRGARTARCAPSSRSSTSSAPAEPPEERAFVADHLMYAPFTAGETVTKQGAVAHFLYVLASGKVDIIRRPEAGGEAKRVATIEAPSFFGEMGLMTGEPRTADVVAVTDVDCYRLDKTGLQRILEERPEVAAEFSRTLALLRRADLADGPRRASTRRPARAASSHGGDAHPRPHPGVLRPRAYGQDLTSHRVPSGTPALRR